MQRILLVTAVAPTPQKTGGLVLEQLLQFPETAGVACAVIVDRFHFAMASSAVAKKFPLLYLRRWNEYVRTVAPNWFTHWYDRHTERRLRRKLITFAKRNNCETVWCMMETSTLINIAVPLAKELQIPLLSYVWDPPEWWLSTRKFSNEDTNEVLQHFANALRMSKKTAVASPRMADEYEKKFNCIAIPFLPSLPAAVRMQDNQPVHDNGPICIALAGQIYATEPWQALVHALDEANWRISNRDIRLRLIGRHDAFVRPPYITATGWIAQKNVIMELAKADILYCPYFFDKERGVVSTLSFPSKLTSYFAAGRPILFHGPASAGPAIFLQQEKTGTICDSLEPTAIKQVLEHIITSPTENREHIENGYRVFSEKFTLDALHKQLKNFLA